MPDIFVYLGNISSKTYIIFFDFSYIFSEDRVFFLRLNNSFLKYIICGFYLNNLILQSNVIILSFCYDQQNSQQNAQPTYSRPGRSVTFARVAENWLKIKERTTKPSTYMEYLRSYTVNLKPAFGKYGIGEITRQMIQDYLFSIIDRGRHRTAEKLKLLLNCIFDLAAEDYGIQSPMKKIVLPYRETKKGMAFTKAEERKLVDFCIQKQDNAASSALLVLLYFGLRQSELKTLRITEDGQLECETSKERMGRNVSIRRIPFTPVFRRVMSYVDFDRARDANTRTVATTLKRLFPNHHPDELRYTFITRCKECVQNGNLKIFIASKQPKFNAKSKQ